MPYADPGMSAPTFLFHPADGCVAGMIRLSWRDAGRQCGFALILATPLVGAAGQVLPAMNDAYQSRPFTALTCNFEGGQTQMPPTLTLDAEQSVSPITDELFQAAPSEWKRETGFVSSVSEITSHPAFRRIVAWGRSSIPYILQDLSRRPSLLTIALGEITGEDPVPAHATGRVTEMSKSWLAWGEKNGLLR
jgi:hypothetical protein